MVTAFCHSSRFALARMLAADSFSPGSGGKCVTGAFPSGAHPPSAFAAEWNKGDAAARWMQERGAVSYTHLHKGLAFSLEWDKAVYPFVRCWYRNDSQGYAMALEPCNYAYSSYSDTDREGMYLHLEPGEIRSTSLAFRAERVES